MNTDQQKRRTAQVVNAVAGGPIMSVQAMFEGEWAWYQVCAFCSHTQYGPDVTEPEHAPACPVVVAWALQRR